MTLEYSQYLERYLWPNYDAPKASDAHIMSIVFMVIEKSREQVPVWEVFQAREENFPALFEAVWALYFKESTSHKERGYMVRFFVHCFQSLENAMVRGVCLQQVALPLWQHLSRARLEIEMRSAPQLEKKWKSMVKKLKKGDLQSNMHLPRLIDHFLKTLSAVQTQVHCV
jgi:intron-binding protein aquarius